MNTENSNFPMHVGIVVTSASQLASVYALLGGVSLAAVVTGGTKPIAERPQAEAEREPAPANNEQSDQGNNGGDAGEIDAHGHPWSADLHAATKGKTKDGLWRMKVGVSRPAPLAGFPQSASTGTSNGGTGSDAGGSAGTGGAPAVEEDDEFAAFRQAAANSDAKGAAAAASVPARKWTDADLGALCNQAAVKLGDPNPVKAIIATFIPDGQVAHSRNIPEDKREEFAKAVETKAGIEFAG